jgi:hypothetical protein
MSIQTSETHVHNQSTAHAGTRPTSAAPAVLGGSDAGHPVTTSPMVPAEISRADLDRAAPPWMGPSRERLVARLHPAVSLPRDAVPLGASRDGGEWVSWQWTGHPNHTARGFAERDGVVVAGYALRHTTIPDLSLALYVGTRLHQAREEHGARGRAAPIVGPDLARFTWAAVIPHFVTLNGEERVVWEAVDYTDWPAELGRPHPALDNHELASMVPQLQHARRLLTSESGALAAVGATGAAVEEALAGRPLTITHVWRHLDLIRNLCRDLRPPEPEATPHTASPGGDGR